MATKWALSSSRPVSRSREVYSSTGRSWWGHRRAGDLGDDPGELGEIESGAAELVGAVALLVLQQGDGSGGGVVPARSRGDPAAAGGAQDLAALEVLVRPVGVVLGVPAVAQQGERDARFAEHPFGVLVLAGQRVGRVVGVEHARVHDARGTRRLGGFDDVGVVDDPLARLAAGDQQQPVHAGERGAQGLGAGVVRLAHLHAARGEVGGLARGAHQGDDVGRGNAAGE